MLVLLPSETGETGGMVVSSLETEYIFKLLIKEHFGYQGVQFNR